MPALLLSFILILPASAGTRAKTPAARVAAAVAGSTAPINIVYPPEGYVHPATVGARVMGWVSHPKSRFRINGRDVKVHPLGGFLAYLPIAAGTFTFHCELELPNGATSFYRTIYVAPPLKADATSQTVIDPAPMRPESDIELRPGDWLTAEMKGTPGGQAQFQIQGKRQKFPMAEINREIGIYRGAYQLQPDDLFESSKIYFYLAGPNKSGTWAAAHGRLTVRAGLPTVVAVKSEEAHVRIGKGESFLLFPPKGTKFLAAGREGSSVRLRLSSFLTGSVPASALQTLPAGTPPPHASLGTVKTQAGPDSTAVILEMSDTVPFIVEPGESPGVVVLRLFYTVDHTNWIIYDPADSFIRDIQWKQEDSETMALAIRLAPSARLWGYRAYWENGSLRLDLRHPPALARSGPVLKGRTIIVDPGHMPSAPGAMGPRGTLEKDVNLAVAKELELLLLGAGARPILTRAGNEEVGLSDRPRIAREKRGDLFISVHNNSMPDGEDPFDRPRGYSIFYYHSHSLKLGQAVHRAYQRGIPLPDEGLRYGDLLVARLTDMPAILTESAYIILPEQEAMLTSRAFQKRLARAMFEGILNFFESERKGQAAAAR